MLRVSRMGLRVCRRGLGLLTLTGALLAGCDSPPYDLAPAAGRVTVDGQPLTGAKVMFAPATAGSSYKVGKPAFGMLNEEGVFELSTYKPGDGAVVGDHWVTLYKMGDSAQTREPGKPKAAKKKSSWGEVSLPQRKSISADEANEFVIELTTEMLRKYARRSD
ncbi:MAG: hypothetical protein AAGA92_01755 [Planctomycetota bacterium]